MVAFLRALPDLEAGAYRQLAYGDAGAPELHTTSFGGAVAECGRCHGADGAGGGPATPLIAGQSEAYLAASMKAFAEGRRASGFMALPAAAVDQAEIDALADHFAELPPRGRTGPEVRQESLARGERIARAGVATEGVPACLGCHGEDRNPLYPRIRGPAAGLSRAAIEPVPGRTARRRSVQPSDDKCGKGPDRRGHRGSGCLFRHPGRAQPLADEHRRGGWGAFQARAGPSGSRQPMCREPVIATGVRGRGVCLAAEG